MNMQNNGPKDKNTFNKHFSTNGRIISAPIRTDTTQNGNDKIIINYYQISSLLTYSIQAEIQKKIFCKYPHPQDGLYTTIWECKQDARQHLKTFCEQNKLKKAFSRLVPTLTDQLDLFDEIQ